MLYSLLVMASSLPTYDALQLHNCFSSTFPRLFYLRRSDLSRRFRASEKVGFFPFRENLRGERKVFYCVCFLCKASTEVDRVSVIEEIERPPFDINVAVVLAGFAFEAYTSPPVNLPESEFLFFLLARVGMAFGKIRENEKNLTTEFAGTMFAAGKLSKDKKA